MWIPGSGAATLAAAASIPGTIPDRMLADGDLKSGKGDRFTFGHAGGTFRVTSRPVPAPDPSDICFTDLSFPRTAWIICDGTVYFRNNRPPRPPSGDYDRITAASFSPDADRLYIQK